MTEHYRKQHSIMDLLPQGGMALRTQAIAHGELSGKPLVCSGVRRHLASWELQERGLGANAKLDN